MTLLFIDSSKAFDTYIFVDGSTPEKAYYEANALLFYIFYFEGFTSIPTALTANDRNRRIQVYQASDG